MIEKLVIKDVVKYKNETIKKMKEVTEWKERKQYYVY